MGSNLKPTWPEVQAFLLEKGLPTGPDLDGRDDGADVAPDVALAPSVALNLARAWLELYVVFPSPEAADTYALFVAVTHAAVAFDTAPYVWVSSPDVDSGKSRLGSEAGAALVHDPEKANQATMAVLFREIEKRKPTVIVDEADQTFSRSKEALADLVGLFNDGYRRGGYVSRHNKVTGKNERFSTFCPKVFISLGQKVPDTIKSRSIPIRMQKRLPRDVIARLRHHRPWADYPPGARLQSALAETFGRTVASLRASYPDIPLAVLDRAGDIWEPLLAVADLAGEDWPARARRAAVLLSSPGATASFDKETAQRAVLRALRTWFEANPERTGIGGEEAVKYLVSEDVEGDFGDWWGSDVQAGRLDKPKARLRSLMRPFDVHPKQIKAVNAKGYRLDDLAPVFNRYLGSGTETTETTETLLASGVSVVSPVSPTPVDEEAS